MRSVVLSVISLSRGVPVRVVIVPPLVRRGLGVALRRVLPLLLAAERRYVEVGPGGSHGLVAAGVDEVGAEDAVAFADERVGAVPLADAEVLVEVVRDRVPGDQRPGHPRLPVLDVLLQRGRRTRAWCRGRSDGRGGRPGRRGRSSRRNRARDRSPYRGRRKSGRRSTAVAPRTDRADWPGRPGPRSGSPCPR